MSASIIPIQPHLESMRRPRRGFDLSKGLAAPKGSILLSEGKEVATTTAPAEALEQALDAYRATILEMAHKRQAFEMQMMLEANTAQIKLEAAGYKAMLAGVPESDIYALGEDMAEALSSAMDTVAGA